MLWHIEYESWGVIIFTERLCYRYIPVVIGDMLLDII